MAKTVAIKEVNEATSKVTTLIKGMKRADALLDEIKDAEPGSIKVTIAFAHGQDKRQAGFDVCPDEVDKLLKVHLKKNADEVKLILKKYSEQIALDADEEAIIKKCEAYK